MRNFAHLPLFRANKGVPKGFKILIQAIFIYCVSFFIGMTIQKAYNFYLISR